MVLTVCVVLLLLWPEARCLCDSIINRRTDRCSWASSEHEYEPLSNSEAFSHESPLLSLHVTTTHLHSIEGLLRFPHDLVRARRRRLGIRRSNSQDRSLHRRLEPNSVPRACSSSVGSHRPSADEKQHRRQKKEGQAAQRYSRHPACFATCRLCEL